MKVGNDGVLVLRFRDALRSELGIDTESERVCHDALGIELWYVCRKRLFAVTSHFRMGIRQMCCTTLDVFACFQNFYVVKLTASGMT